MNNIECKCRVCEKKLKITIDGTWKVGLTRVSEDGVYFNYCEEAAVGCWFCNDCWKLMGEMNNGKDNRKNI